MLQWEEISLPVLFQLACKTSIDPPRSCLARHSEIMASELLSDGHKVAAMVRALMGTNFPVPTVMLARGRSPQVFFCITCNIGPLTISAFDKRPQRHALHVGHSKLEIFQSSELQPSVRLSEMVRFLGTDMEQIQTYVNKLQPIFFLKSPESALISQTLPCCRACGRALLNGSFSFCSLQCKFSPLMGLVMSEEEEDEFFERASASLTVEERHERFIAGMKRGCKCAHGDYDCKGRPVQSGTNL